MAPPSSPSWEDMQAYLSTPGTDIRHLYRTIFCLRAAAPSEEAGIQALVDSLKLLTEETQPGGELKERDWAHTSDLFRHECCYLLGQMGADTSDLGLKKLVFSALLDVLTDLTEDEVTRHEAAEGIAAVFNNNVGSEENGRLDPSITAYLEQKLKDVRTELGAPRESKDGQGSPSYEEEERDAERDAEVGAGGHATPSTTPSTGSISPSLSAQAEEVAGPEHSIDPLGPAASAFQQRNSSLITLLQLFIPSGAADLTNSPLGQTCYLAVEGLKRDTARVCACQYASYDPAIGVIGATPAEIPAYERQLLGPMIGSSEQPQAFVNTVTGPDAAIMSDMYPRYVAMFTLRNLGACASLARVLSADRTSPVLRHEIAFLLGQMDDDADDAENKAGTDNSNTENDIATSALIENLAEPDEHVMVRHESAIALGSRGGEAAKLALRRFSCDEKPLVAESCMVALDTIEYWEAWDAEEKRIMAL